MTTPPKLDKTTEEALGIFAGASTAAQRRDALTALISSKFLPKQADTPAIKTGRDLLLNDARVHPEPAPRLLAIAESVRLARVVKRWQADMEKGLENAFDSEIPPMGLLAEADDRLNVARACGLFKRDWMPVYLARSIADEEQGEGARAALVEALLGQGGSLADVLRLLGRQFEQIRPATEAPGDSVAKRLTRTLVAVRAAIVESENEAGEGLGEALHALVYKPLAAVGKPQDAKAKIDLSTEVVLAVHDVVRTRLSVVAESSMYQAVGYCRQLLGGGSWPQEMQKPLDRLIADVSEALVLLGRQGQRDQGLLGQLDVLCNHPERARFLAKNLATRHPELPEDVRDWLERGRVRNIRAASDAALEAAASNADASIGLALQAARQARQLGEGLGDRLISSLEVYEPALVSSTQACLDGMKALAIQVEQAAQLRSLGLYGQAGEEIDMSAKFFDVVGGNPRQRMVVRQPAVVKIRADGAVGDVVLKGLVE